MLEKVSGSQQNNCENCLKEQATGYCKQCSRFFCQTCIDKHNSWVDFTSHQILGVEDVTNTASKLIPLKEQLTMECSSHGEPLKVYCDTCDKLICQLCTTSKAHRNHDYEPITDSFPRHRQQIVDNLKKVKEKLTAFTTVTQAVETCENDILEQVVAARRDIEATVEKLVQLLQDLKRQSMRELDQVTDAYIKKISAFKKESDITITKLKSCKEFAEEGLRIGSQQQILVMKRQMVEHMAAVCSLDNLQPVEEIRVRFIKGARVLEAFHSLGSVVRFGQFKAAGDEASFDLCSAAPFPSKQVSCQLSPAVDPTVIVRCVVHQVTPGKFKVHYSPPTAGLHQLRVQVGGSDILDAPLNVSIMPRRAVQRFNDLSDPRGLAITKEGHLIVLESGKHCITFIDPANTRKTRSIGQFGKERVQFNNPQGVAMTQNGRIVVSDYMNRRLKVLTSEGAFIATIGTKGFRPQYPTGVFVHHNGQIFVADKCNHRIMVFNDDFTYSHSFGREGAQPGDFSFPQGLAFDADGMVYVADHINNRVQKFSPDGRLLAVINRRGEGGDRLNRPHGLCVDANDILYVTEWSSNTVSMFSSNGKFLGYIGDSDGSSFNRPKYIVSDKIGRLYISDNNGVITY